MFDSNLIRNEIVENQKHIPSEFDGFMIWIVHLRRPLLVTRAGREAVKVCGLDQVFSVSNLLCAVSFRRIVMETMRLKSTSVVFLCHFLLLRLFRFTYWNFLARIYVLTTFLATYSQLRSMVLLIASWL